MARAIINALGQNLLGSAPQWYKLTIVFFLMLNPIVMQTAGPFFAGWVFISQFIFTLTMAIKCYPLPAGGLLAAEAIFLGMTSPQTVYNEILHNFPVILLLIFMVAGIYFMQDLLQYTFTKIFVQIRSKIIISLLFCSIGALLSAFLDALTVTAVIISVAYRLYSIYHCFVSDQTRTYNLCDDNMCQALEQDNLKEFRGYLRNLVMHGAVGTALGGVTTLVGEPQNLLIGHEMGWTFTDFFTKVAPVSLPVLLVGLITCTLVERFRIFDYGYSMPDNVRFILLKESTQRDEKRGKTGQARLLTQACVGIWLIIALAFHLAEAGIIGLSVIVALTALNGITEEHRIGNAFKNALPFTALLIVFSAVVAVIHDQQLFTPVIQTVLAMNGRSQLAAYYIANGLLSAISDNVFVATVYITETKKAFLAAAGAISHEQFDLLAVAINTGTNIPSVATPNGQASFLFLLTSTLATVIRLSYGRMILQALPYTINISLVGLLATWYMPEIASWFITLFN